MLAHHRDPSALPEQKLESGVAFQAAAYGRFPRRHVVVSPTPAGRLSPRAWLGRSPAAGRQRHLRPLVEQHVSQVIGGREVDEDAGELPPASMSQSCAALSATSSVSRAAFTFGDSGSATRPYHLGFGVSHGYAECQYVVFEHALQDQGSLDGGRLEATREFLRLTPPDPRNGRPRPRPACPAAAAWPRAQPAAPRASLAPSARSRPSSASRPGWRALRCPPALADALSAVSVLPAVPARDIDRAGRSAMAVSEHDPLDLVEGDRSRRGGRRAWWCGR